MIQAAWDLLLLVFGVTAVICGLIGAVTVFGPVLTRMLRGTS